VRFLEMAIEEELRMKIKVSPMVEMVFIANSLISLRTLSGNCTQFSGLIARLVLAKSFPYGLP
jgi:hypothetical protein